MCVSIGCFRGLLGPQKRSASTDMQKYTCSFSLLFVRVDNWDVSIGAWRPRVSQL
jgi:hypothetical protein